MADIRVCRLCKTKINKQVAVALFSSSGSKQRWAPRISVLLDVPEPSPDDLLPAHMWEVQDQDCLLGKGLFRSCNVQTIGKIFLGRQGG